MKMYLCIVAMAVLLGGCACTVESDPQGAHVSLDGEYMGTTPCSFQWPGGFYDKATIEVSKRTYETETRQVKRNTSRLFVVLHPEAASQGQQQSQQQQMQGPTIVFGSQSGTGQQAVQVKQYGSVSFASDPSGAEVLVDGKLIGTTPVSKCRFEEGTYKVVMKLAGHEEWSRTIIVTPSGDQAIAATLPSKGAPQ